MGVSVTAELAFMQLARLGDASEVQHACIGCRDYSQQQRMLLDLDVSPKAHVSVGAKFFCVQKAAHGWQLRGGLQALPRLEGTLAGCVVPLPMLHGLGDDIAGGCHIVQRIFSPGAVPALDMLACGCFSPCVHGAGTRKGCRCVRTLWKWQVCG